MNVFENYQPNKTRFLTINLQTCTILFSNLHKVIDIKSTLLEAYQKWFHKNEKMKFLQINIILKYFCQMQLWQALMQVMSLL
jgi:transposase